MFRDDAKPVWIAERDVVELLTLRDAIEALERALEMEASGQTASLEKTHTAWGEGHTLHALGAAYQAEQLVGTKTWAHTERGATPLLILWGSETGELRAVIEAFALGQLRTAALTGVATRWLADASADSLALVGAGAQALAQAAACAAVRRLRQIVVFSRKLERASAVAKRLEEELDASVRATTSIAGAVRDSAIVTTVTRAREPLVHGDMLAPGSHVNAVGAITPERRELGVEVVEGASVIACDNVASARRLASDLIAALGDDSERWARVRPLSAVVDSGLVPSPRGALTLYKAMGSGLADVALGHAVLERLPAGAGAPLSVPVRVPPRLFNSTEWVGHS